MEMDASLPYPPPLGHPTADKPQRQQRLKAKRSSTHRNTPHLQLSNSPVTFSSRCSHTPAWLHLLLLLAGDVEMNPGPTRRKTSRGPSNSWPCSSCAKPIYINQRSYFCYQCNLWVHSRCSLLTHEKEHSTSWYCPACTSPPRTSSVSAPSSRPSTPLLPDPIRPRSHSAPVVQQPQPQLPPPTTLNLLQLNCNGIQSSQHQLSALLHEKNIHIAAIQETKLCDDSFARLTPNCFPGYSFSPKHRDSHGGGIALLVRHNIPFSPLCTHDLFDQNDAITDIQAIQVTLGSSTLNIINLYIPPEGSCPRRYSPDLSRILNLPDAIILGDFNAHHQLWYSTGRESQRSKDLVDAINNSTICPINEDTPTRLPSNGAPSSPDISLLDSRLVPTSTWATLTSMNSDHLPILISLELAVRLPTRTKKTYMNLKKANWEGYTQESENLIRNLPPPSSCAKDEAGFRNALLTAAKHHIPSGYVKDFVPSLPKTAIDLIKTRDSIRSHNPSDPSLAELNDQINEHINEACHDKWVNTLQKAEAHPTNAAIFNVLKSLNGKYSGPPPNQPVKFGHKYLSSKKKIANALNKQFSRVVVRKQTRRTRKVQRKIHATKLDAQTAPSFSPEQVANAIRNASNSKAKGPDGLTIFHLKHLGPLGILFLTQLYNLSLQQVSIPSIWKTSNIVPLLKPGKPADEGSSYRPISLLSPSVKVLEALLLPTLNTHLPLNQAQHGFRPLHSTTSALLQLSTQVATGFNQRKPERTVAVAIDISKAFDTVDHTLLIEMLSNSDLPHNVTRWLSAYLRGRCAATIYHDTRSSHQSVIAGVPQGSIISPTLFNFFVSDFPTPPPGISVTSYADDFTIYCTRPQYQDAADALTSYLDEVDSWATNKSLSISAPKSHVTLFTSATGEKQSIPSVNLGPTTLALEQNPTILGVTFDPMWTFSAHIKRITQRANSRLNIMKALTGTSWGWRKETLLLTYRSIIHPILLYAAPIWYPAISASTVAPLQVIQNHALRLVTGCTKMTQEDHLHRECNLLKVNQSLQLLCDQYLASSLRDEHPCSPIVKPPPTPRNMKDTLYSFSIKSVQPLLTEGIMPSGNYKTALSVLHTSAVGRAIVQQAANPVLNQRAPDIDPSEASLQQPVRKTLSQLRSSFCTALMSYQARLDPSKSQACPLCGARRHSTVHLFNCPSQPTDLRPADLWDRPTQVADFIRRHPCFRNLSLPEPTDTPPPVAASAM